MAPTQSKGLGGVPRGQSTFRGFSFLVNLQTLCSKPRWRRIRHEVWLSLPPKLQEWVWNLHLPPYIRSWLFLPKPVLERINREVLRLYYETVESTLQKS